MTAARLFDVDRTPTERRALRRSNRAAQGGLFDLAAEPAPDRCAVCAGDHRTTDCPHGTAPELFDAEPAERTRCDRTYSNAARNPYLRRSGQCVTCGVDRDEHRYPTAAECGAENTWSASSAADRIYLATGRTDCPDCPGDLTDADHWTTCDIAGKVIPWQAPDMFAAAALAARPHPRY